MNIEGDLQDREDNDNLSANFATSEVFKQQNHHTRQSIDTNATGMTFPVANVEGAILTDSEDGGQQRI